MAVSSHLVWNHRCSFIPVMAVYAEIRSVYGMSCVGYSNFIDNCVEISNLLVLCNVWNKPLDIAEFLCGLLNYREFHAIL